MVLCNIGHKDGMWLLPTESIKLQHPFSSHRLTQDYSRVKPEGPPPPTPIRLSNLRLPRR